MSDKQNTFTEAELKEKYRKYIKEFTDEIENTTSLQRIYNYVQYKWQQESKQDHGKEN